MIGSRFEDMPFVYGRLSISGNRVKDIAGMQKAGGWYPPAFL